MVVILVLMVTIASCGLTQPMYDDYAERRPVGREVYLDPYYGNAPMIVRDPYTGRYYEVAPVGPYGSYSGARPYYGNRGSRYYGRSHNRAPVYNNPPRNQNNNTPRGGNNNPQPNNRGSEKIDRAKDIINGNR
jgi:hypothetical protein